LAKTEASGSRFGAFSREPASQLARKLYKSIVIASSAAKSSCNKWALDANSTEAPLFVVLTDDTIIGTALAIYIIRFGFI
jgi:hypothetical protein